MPCELRSPRSVQNCGHSEIGRVCQGCQGGSAWRPGNVGSQGMMAGGNVGSVDPVGTGSHHCDLEDPRGGGRGWWEGMLEAPITVVLIFNFILCA